MATPQLLAVLYLLAVAVVSAQPSPPPLPQQQLQPPPPPIGRTVSTVITAAISAFFLLVFFCVFLNQCRFADGGALHGSASSGGQGFPGCRRRGLDPAVTATFPILTYREVREHKIGAGVLECAVCITAFEDGDDLRLLPQCFHAFHPDCIDPWLQGHVTCPLCRADLEKPAPAPVVAPPSPEPAAVAVQVDAEDNEEERRKEEAVELERLRSARRAARMPRSHSTGHSLITATSAAAAAAEWGDHDRFTLRLPPHVREEVLKSRRLRHATSLVIFADVRCEGSSRESGGGGGSSHGGWRWPAFLATTVSWARAGGEGSMR